KMDVVGADFDNAVLEVRERLEGTPVPLVIPVGSGSVKDSSTPFRGVVDLLEQKAYFADPATEGKSFHTTPVPQELQGEVQRWREHLFEVLTRFDDNDQITSHYLEGKEIPIATLRQVIRAQTLARHIQPVLCGSGREHAGIQPLMDAVCHYLPNPLERP